MDNPETPATLSTQDTGRSQTKKKKTQTNHSITQKIKKMIGLQREIAKKKN